MSTLNKRALNVVGGMGYSQMQPMNKELLRQILQVPRVAATYPSLDEMGITQTVLDKIYLWAHEMATYGELADYIPQLKNVNPQLNAIVIADLNNHFLAVGDGLNVKVSIQSVIKPFLYLYALEQGQTAESIAAIEATALRFNTDDILWPGSSKNKPGHPLNNAGAISSAGAIRQFEEFLEFMRALTGSWQLDSMQEVFSSEMASNSNNRAIAYRLVAAGRFKSQPEGERALEFYTRTCSIGVTTSEIVTACLVMASGGKKSGKQIVKSDHVVRAINAMNSYGLYEHTSEISLLAAGARALSCKSGVGGLIINIDPGRGAFCTYGPKLDSAGNSVFGKYALIPLNHILAAPNALRLSSDEIIRSLEIEK